MIRFFHPSIARKKLVLWGGLRGGISVALVLSLPSDAERDLLLTGTYVVVVFSILFQGLTIPWLLRKVMAEQAAEVSSVRPSPF